MAFVEISLTPREYVRLKREECMTDKEIADQLFISTATLSRWKRVVGVRGGRTSKDYLNLKSEGYTDEQISIQWGITRSALHQWKAKRNLTKRNS